MLVVSGCSDVTFYNWSLTYILNMIFEWENCYEVIPILLFIYLFYSGILFKVKGGFSYFVLLKKFHCVALLWSLLLSQIENAFWTDVGWCQHLLVSHGVWCPKQTILLYPENVTTVITISSFWQAQQDLKLKGVQCVEML